MLNETPLHKRKSRIEKKEFTPIILEEKLASRPAGKLQEDGFDEALGAITHKHLGTSLTHPFTPVMQAFFLWASRGPSIPDFFQCPANRHASDLKAQGSITLQPGEKCSNWEELRT